MAIADSFSHTSISNRFREVEWRRHLSEQGTEEKVIHEMKPFLRKVEAFTLYDLPQYLFRVWSESSAGFNCEKGEHLFQSQAVKVGLGATDFDLMTEAEIRENLRKHLHWEVGAFYSHWVSFTCSFMFALVHAWRMVLMGKENVMLAVINTYTLKTPGRIFSAFPLIRAYDIHDVEIKDSVYGEFLAYDELKAEMEVISFSDLLHPKSDKSRFWLPGLLDLCPFLKYSEAEMKKARRRGLWSKHKRFPLKSRVKKFRERLFQDHDILQISSHRRPTQAIVPRRLWHGKCAGPFPMSREILEDFYGLVRLFKTGFRLPVLVSFLSLITLKWDQESMEKRVIEMFQDDALFEDFTFYHTGYVLSMLPELRMFQEMMENILISLGEPVVKGNERPRRQFLNPNSQSYVPGPWNLHSEFLRTIPLPLEREEGINLL